LGSLFGYAEFSNSMEKIGERSFKSPGIRQIERRIFPEWSEMAAEAGGVCRFDMDDVVKKDTLRPLLARRRTYIGKIVI